MIIILGYLQAQRGTCSFKVFPNGCFYALSFKTLETQKYIF